MAHGGKEARFGAARRFGAIARFGQSFFKGFALGDVAPHTLHFDQTPASITQREIFPCDPAPAVSRADELIVARACMAHFESCETRNAAAVGMKLGCEGASECLLRHKTEEAEESVVGIGEAAVGRAAEDGVALRVDEAFVAGFAFMKPCVDGGHSFERSLEPFRHRVQFGAAVLQRTGTAAGFEKPCE